MDSYVLAGHCVDAMSAFLSETAKGVLSGVSEAAGTQLYDAVISRLSGNGAASLVGKFLNPGTRESARDDMVTVVAGEVRNDDQFAAEVERLVKELESSAGTAPRQVIASGGSAAVMGNGDATLGPKVTGDGNVTGNGNVTGDGNSITSGSHNTTHTRNISKRDNTFRDVLIVGAVIVGLLVIWFGVHRLGDASDSGPNTDITCAQFLALPTTEQDEIAHAVWGSKSQGNPWLLQNAVYNCGYAKNKKLKDVTVG